MVVQGFCWWWTRGLVGPGERQHAEVVPAGNRTLMPHPHMQARWWHWRRGSHGVVLFADGVTGVHMLSLV